MALVASCGSEKQSERNSTHLLGTQMDLCYKASLGFHLWPPVSHHSFFLSSTQFFHSYTAFPWRFSLFLMVLQRNVDVEQLPTKMKQNNNNKKQQTKQTKQTIPPLAELFAQVQHFTSQTQANKNVPFRFYVLSTRDCSTGFSVELSLPCLFPTLTVIL